MKVNKGMVESFIRTRRDMGLTDREIAAELGVGTTTVAHWRNHFGIPTADKFRKHFIEIYGPNALEHFRLMVEAKTTLAEIAVSFGFSREYARLVYKKLYKKPYGRDHLKKW